MRDMIPLLIAILLALWAFAALRLGRAAQPLRLQLAEEGQKILATNQLSPAQRELVRYCLNTAFAHRFGLLFGIFFVPAYAIKILIKPQLLESAGARFLVPDTGTRMQFHQFMRLHNRITFLNHPLLVMLLDFEITLFIAPAIALSAIVNGSVTEKVNHDSAMGLIDEKSIQIARRFPMLPKAA